MSRLFLLGLLFSMSQLLFAQSNEMEKLPFHQIPEAPEDYSPGNVIGRYIDGLGYRYYWATKDLRPEDIAYKPSEDSRDVRHTLEHICGLTQTTLNAAKNVPNESRINYDEMNFDQLRARTLNNLDEASKLMKGKNKKEIEELKVVFKRSSGTSEYPYWNMINGPLSDALYHVGQIVSHRRASGNPIHPGVSVFTGKTRE